MKEWQAQAHCSGWQEAAFSATASSPVERHVSQRSNRTWRINVPSMRVKEEYRLELDLTGSTSAMATCLCRDLGNFLLFPCFHFFGRPQGLQQAFTEHQLYAKFQATHGHFTRKIQAISCLHRAYSRYEKKGSNYQTSAQIRK